MLAFLHVVLRKSEQNDLENVVDEIFFRLCSCVPAPGRIDRLVPLQRCTCAKVLGSTIDPSPCTVGLELSVQCLVQPVPRLFTKPWPVPLFITSLIGKRQSGPLSSTSRSLCVPSASSLAYPSTMLVTGPSCVDRGASREWIGPPCKYVVCGESLSTSLPRDPREIQASRACKISGWARLQKQHDPGNCFPFRLP
jgi:hypothetical protein